MVSQKFKDYIRLAYGSAKHRKVRSWLTMIGIFIGIAAVVALVSLSQGLEKAIAQQFSSLGTDKLIVQAAGGGFGPPGTAVPTPLTTADKKVIENVKGVEVAVGRLIRIVRLQVDDETKFTYAVSLPHDPQEEEVIIEANNYKIVQGSFFNSDTSKEVVLGYDFAQDFFDKPLALRDKIFIQGEQFKVVGILKKSGNPQQDSTLLLPEGSLRRILNIGDQFDVIPLQIQPGENIDQVTESLQKALRRQRGVEEGKEDFVIETPQQIINSLNTILNIVQGILVGIAAISLLVGGVGIMNTMYTAVVERRKEIGIMKAVGARNGEIMTLFLIESGFLGFFGGLIGVILGFLISKLVEVIATQALGSELIKANISIPLLVGTLLFAFIVGAFSGMFPARQAAKLNPIEALRK